MTDAATFHSSRCLPHAPAAVFAAFCDGEVLASWWGPNGFRNGLEAFDFRVGGESR